MSKKFDPLEEAKIPEKSEKKESKKLFGKKKKKAEEKKPEPAAAPPPPPPPSDRADTKPDKPQAPSAPDASAGKKYRVLEDKMCSVGGRMTKVRAGKILEARFYGGPVGLQRLLDSGIKVEEC
jgi:hypothetical protein